MLNKDKIILLNKGEVHLALFFRLFLMVLYMFVCLVKKFETATKVNLSVLNVFKQRENYFYVLMQDLYADDCDPVAHSREDMQLLMNKLFAICNRFGLIISLKKTVGIFRPAPEKLYVQSKNLCLL